VEATSVARGVKDFAEFGRGQIGVTQGGGWQSHLRLTRELRNCGLRKSNLKKARSDWARVQFPNYQIS